MFAVFKQLLVKIKRWNPANYWCKKSQRPTLTFLNLHRGVCRPTRWRLPRSCKLLKVSGLLQLGEYVEVASVNSAFLWRNLQAQHVLQIFPG